MELKGFSEKALAILEKHDVYHFNNIQQDKDCYAEMSFYSPAGEDFVFCIFHDNTEQGFAKAFKEYANDFDPDEHAEMWIEGRGKRGVPDSIRTLIDDADDIKKKLLDISQELELNFLK